MVSIIEWNGREWVGCHPAIGDREIQDAEKIIGVTFPQDFEECAKRCHGGRPRDNAFAFDDPDVGRMESCVGVLLSFSPEDPENIATTYSRLKPHLPKGVVPFADDGGGDFTCFYYGAQKDSMPTIVYWHHGEESVVHLSNTFSEFLGKLYGVSAEFKRKED